MKVYVVTYVEHENGGRAVDEVVGVYADKDKARLAMEDKFHEACDKYGVEELGEYDYLNEDCFCIEDGDNCMYEAFGSITECELKQKGKE